MTNSTGAAPHSTLVMERKRPTTRLVAGDDRIGPELEARLQEDAQIVGPPGDRLRQRVDSDDVTFEVGRPLGRLHVPIAAADTNAQDIVQLIGEQTIELDPPAGTIFRNGAVEGAD